MIRSLIELLEDGVGALRLPRRWDGKNVSKKGTLTSAFRILAGTQPGVGPRWATYATAVGPGHLWIGRKSVYVQDVSPELARSPAGRELVTLDRDFVVVPVVASSGARLEWALRESALNDVLRLLDLKRRTERRTND